MVQQMPWLSLPCAPASALGTACRVSINVQALATRKTSAHHSSACQALLYPCAPHLEFSLLLPHSTTLPPCFHNTLCNLSLPYRLTMASIVEKQLQSLLDGFDALRLEYQRVYSRCAVLEAQMVTAKSQVSLSHALPYTLHLLHVMNNLSSRPAAVRSFDR